MKFLVLSASILVLLSGCSQGRKQYKSPSDQRLDQKAGRPDVSAPSTPTNPAASLVDGWFVDPTPEEVAAKISEAIRSPIVPTLGLAGVTTRMSRSEIEAKIGQPDFVTRDDYLRPLAVYGSGAFLVFYDRVTKNKVEMLLAGNGYTGSISTFDELKISSDLAPIFAAEGGPETFLKKLYQASHPSVEDCTQEQLCQLIKGQGLALLRLSNTISILYQDEPAKTNKKIFEIRIEARNPDSGAFKAEDWSFDLLSGTLQNADAKLVPGSSTWAQTRSLGDLSERVEAGDFARGLTEYVLGLENTLGFGFERVDYKNAKALTPSDDARLTSLSAGQAFLGSFRLGTDTLSLQLCPSVTPVPQNIASVLSVKLKGLNASEEGELSPSAEAPLSSLWTVKVAAVSQEAASADCVSTPLRGALDATLTTALEAAVAKTYAETFPDASKAPAALAVDVKGELTVSDVFDPAAKSFAGNPIKVSQALSKFIYQQSFAATLAHAQKNLSASEQIQVLPSSGDASIEDQQTIQSSFLVYKDAAFENGTQVSLYYFESSQNLLFETTRISPEFRNTNAGLSVLKDQEINLDQALSFGQKQFQVGGVQAPGSVAELNLFDRSLRFAELDGSDPVAYAERVAVNVTDGLQSKNHIFDLLLVWNNLSLYGSRKDNGLLTQTSFQVQGIEAEGLPEGTRFLLSCAGQEQTLQTRASFPSVYEQLKACGLFLTPGYATENVPSELHIAPEGTRAHGLTLKFTDGLLSGFMVYDTNSLSL